jgi:1,4-alpha-glucan branching enzyme
MSIKKKYLETLPECKVTFKLSKKVANSASKANLVGEFNNWSVKKAPMKKLKSGDFSITVSLPKDQEYQFKYLLDGKEWVNEESADKLIPNVYNTENSVVVV